MRRRNRVTLVIVGLLIVVGLVLVFRPSPVPVQTATVHRGTLREITQEEGKTRMHDHFILAATVSGKLRRIDLHAGDAVQTGQTVA
jgi:HlyD family secretion protein